MRRRSPGTVADLLLNLFFFCFFFSFMDIAEIKRAESEPPTKPQPTVLFPKGLLKKKKKVEVEVAHLSIQRLAIFHMNCRGVGTLVLCEKKY